MLAVNLEPCNSLDSRIDEAEEIETIYKALTVDGVYPGSKNNVPLRIAPGYSGNEIAIGRLKQVANTPIIREESELFLQVLSRLPPSTRSTPF